MKKETSWLDDDPEWEALKRKTANQPGQASPAKLPQHNAKVAGKQGDKSEPKEVKVSVNLKLPTLPKVSRRQRKLLVGSIAGLCCLVALFVVLKIASRPEPASTPQVVNQPAAKPTFPYLLPDGKAEETTSKGINYNPEKKVVLFADKLENTPINVSQQPLPETFKDNPDTKVKKFAEDLYANEVINESNPKAYMGKNENGTQTVIFHKNDLLVFLVARRPLEKASWAEYITKMK